MSALRTKRQPSSLRTAARKSRWCRSVSGVPYEVVVDISTEAEDGYIRQLADWCRSCADVVLDHERVYFQPQHGIDSDLAFAVDWRYFSESLPGTATCPAHEPATWIALIASTYLTESALLCRSMASLLDGGTFAVGLDVLTRAVLERNGRLQWVLDDKATSRQRGARAGLEMTVCQQHYRRSIEQIAHERVDKKAAKVEHVRLREGLAALFGSVQKP